MRIDDCHLLAAGACGVAIWQSAKAFLARRQAREYRDALRSMAIIMKESRKDG